MVSSQGDSGNPYEALFKTNAPQASSILPFIVGMVANSQRAQSSASNLGLDQERFKLQQAEAYMKQQAELAKQAMEISRFNEQQQHDIMRSTTDLYNLIGMQQRSEQDDPRQWLTLFSDNARGIATIQEAAKTRHEAALQKNQELLAGMKLVYDSFEKRVKDGEHVPGDPAAMADIMSKNGFEARLVADPRIGNMVAALQQANMANRDDAPSRQLIYDNAVKNVVPDEGPTTSESESMSMYTQARNQAWDNYQKALLGGPSEYRQALDDLAQRIGQPGGQQSVASQPQEQTPDPRFLLGYADGKPVHVSGPAAFGGTMTGSDGTVTAVPQRGASPEDVASFDMFNQAAQRRVEHTPAQAIAQVVKQQNPQQFASQPVPQSQFAMPTAPQPSTGLNRASMAGQMSIDSGDENTMMEIYRKMKAVAMNGGGGSDVFNTINGIAATQIAPQYGVDPSDATRQLIKTLYHAGILDPSGAGGQGRFGPTIPITIPRGF